MADRRKKNLREVQDKEEKTKVEAETPQTPAIRSKEETCGWFSWRMLFHGVIVAVFVILVMNMTKSYSSNNLTVFVTGKAGSGKTSLIYGLLGVDEEEMSRKRKIAAVTLQTGNVTRNGVKTIVLERRSLEHDESGVDSNEVEQVQNVDFILYSVRMDDARCRPGHKTGLRKLGHHFGADIWNKTIIVLTFANRVDFVNKNGKLESNKELLEEKRIHWSQCIHEVLSEEKIPEIIRKEIPIVPVGYYKKPMLFEESWIDALYSKILSRVVVSKAQKNLKLAFNIKD